MFEMNTCYRFLILCIICLYNSPSFSQNMDIDLLRKWNVNRNKSLDRPMEFVSDAEYIVGIAAPLSVAVYGFLAKDSSYKAHGIQLCAALFVNTASTYALKKIVNRPRPATSYSFIDTKEIDKYLSFPSGHTSNAFVTASSLSFCYPKWYVIAPSFLWAGGVAYSRMHLGAHYPSDVLAGAIVGVASAWITHKGNQWLRNKYYQKRILGEL